MRVFLLIAFFIAAACSAKGKMDGSAPPSPPAEMAAMSPGAAGGAPPMDVATTDSMDEDAAPALTGEARREFASPRPEPEPAGRDTAEQAVEKREMDAAARHIIYTAAMVISVFNLEDAMARAEAIPETYGGYIQTMSTGLVVLRVPSKSLRKVMEDVAEYGIVEQRSLQAQDVTAEFVDIDSRLRALEETHKQLLELLSKARTVKEALEVREALDRITGELEVLKGRMRQLQNLISFSTLSLTLQERGPHVPTPSSNDPFPWVNELGVESTEWR